MAAVSHIQKKEANLAVIQLQDQAHLLPCCPAHCGAVKSQHSFVACIFDCCTLGRFPRENKGTPGLPKSAESLMDL